jgi:alkanesulfonate monooxygenase SsuD/methylene tetrahydromethanopterin reductase-like flavin-dependent oxidoreductase (luciferase family)
MEGTMDFGLFSMFSAREGFTQSQTFDEWFGLVRLAEEAAMVDHISQGRLLFGVGRSSFIESYQGYNVDYAESRSRFFESLEVIQKAWTESSFSYHGEHYDFDDVNLTPKPLQTPHPPIRVAVESRETFSLIGSLGFPIFIRHQMDVPELKELLDGYKEQRELAGFDGPNDVILQLAAYVGNSPEEARSTPEASTMRARRLVRESLSQAADEEAYERLKRISEVTYDDVLTRVAYGTPEEVADRIR